MNTLKIVGTARLAALLILPALLITPRTPAFAEDRQASVADPTAQVEIAEVGAVIVESADGLKVTKVTPPGARADKYRDVDIKKGDRIVSINGQRIGTLTELRTALSALKVGDQVRLGSIRAAGPALAAYTVGSEEDLKVSSDSPIWEGDGVRRVVTVGGEPQDKGAPGERQSVAIKLGPGAAPLLELAAIVETVDGRATVTRILPMPAQVPEEARLRDKDVIVSIQGEQVIDAAFLKERYESIAVGQEITLVVERDGKETQLAFAKPKMQGQVMYKSKQGE